MLTARTYRIAGVVVQKNGHRRDATVEGRGQLAVAGLAQVRHRVAFGGQLATRATGQPPLQSPAPTWAHCVGAGPVQGYGPVGAEVVARTTSVSVLGIREQFRRPQTAPRSPKRSRMARPPTG